MNLAHTFFIELYPFLTIKCSVIKLRGKERRLFDFVKVCKVF